MLMAAEENSEGIYRSGSGLERTQLSGCVGASRFLLCGSPASVLSAFKSTLCTSVVCSVFKRLAKWKNKTPGSAWLAGCLRIELS